MERSDASVSVVLAVKKRYDEFDESLKKFKTALSEVLATITIEAQRFYDLHFTHADVSPIQFGVVLRNPDTLFDRAQHIALICQQ
jgi:RIO-like serine/threonine protein kinase